MCTIGPATDSAEAIEELVTAGMNVARLNMSHGDHLLHAKRVGWIRDAARSANRPIGILADLQGPKIRLGKFPDGPVMLVNGSRFTITTEDVPGDAQRASTTLSTLTDDVTAGDQILINDGAIELKVLEVTDADVVTEVVVGGMVSDHKGINLPGVPVSVPALSEKDERDLRYRAENDAATGLGNHATTQDLVAAALAKPAVREHSVCVVLDIDDFTAVNDNSGHMEGDALLRKVGSVLRSSFRESDVIGRVGGDEFVLLLKEVDMDVVLRKLNQVRAQISATTVPGLGHAPTLSVGVYATCSDDRTSVRVRTTSAVEELILRPPTMAPTPPPIRPPRMPVTAEPPASEFFEVMSGTST